MLLLCLPQASLPKAPVKLDTTLSPSGLFGVLVPTVLWISLSISLHILTSLPGVDYGPHHPSSNLDRENPITESVPTGLVIPKLTTSYTNTTPLTRSRSPALANLDRCDSMLSVLNCKVDTLSRRLSDTSSSGSTMSAKRRCHGCHGYVDEDHRGFATGADRVTGCQRDHDDRCEGGILDGKDKKGQFWRGCPLDFLHVEDGDDSFLSNYDGGVGLEGDDLTSQFCTLKLGSETKSSASASTLPVVSSSTSTATTTVVSSSAGPKLSTHGDPLDSVADQLAATKTRLAALKKRREQMEELAELQRQEQHEHTTQTEILKNLQTSEGIHGGGRPKIREQAAQLRARNQTAAQSNQDHGYYEGYTMPQIRKVPGLAEIVEGDVVNIRSDVATLARHPSAPIAGLQGQASSSSRAKVPHMSRGRPVQRGPSFVNDLVDFGENASPLMYDRPLQKARLRSNNPLQSQQADLLGDDDPLTDASEEDDEAGQQFVLTYRRDAQGHKYRTYEPVIAEPSPEPEIEPVFGWFTDPKSGRQYKKQIYGSKPTQSIKQVKPTSASSQAQGQRSGSFSERRSTQTRSSSDRQTTVHERTAAFVPLGAPEKEGKADQKMSIVDWVKKCPVLWADKVKSENMNVVVWMWGYLSEILATRTGSSPELEPGELEARLQHVLCVLEVCASHSDMSDFDHQGWKIARLYAKKVQAQLDRGLVTWDDFKLFRSNPHPSELIAAKQELEPKQVLNKKKQEELIKGRGQCTTWNTSKVEKKCDWMARNPDKGPCNRKHECSYCKEKGHGTTHHQRTFCARRIAAGDS